MEVGGQLHAPAVLLHDTHLIGGWVSLTASLNVVAKRKIPAENRIPVVQPVA